MQTRRRPTNSRRNHPGAMTMISRLLELSERTFLVLLSGVLLLEAASAAERTQEALSRPANAETQRVWDAAGRHQMPDRWWESATASKTVTFKKDRRYAHEISIEPEEARLRSEPCIDRSHEAGQDDWNRLTGPSADGLRDGSGGSNASSGPRGERRFGLCAFCRTTVGGTVQCFH